MIPNLHPTQQYPSWQKQLANGFKDVKSLLDYCEIRQDCAENLELLQKQFPLRTPISFAARMQKGDINDPLLQQVLSSVQELELHSEFTQDPLDEHQFRPINGLLHKYKNRVLLTLTGACAIHCRYCFRRHYPYSDNLWQKNKNDIISYLQNHPEINEVILSGGDPLIASDAILQQCLDAIDTIAHIKNIRIHSRIPIVLPARITPDFLKLIRHRRCRLIVVTHCNHANELNQEVYDAIQLLTQQNVFLLNQTVLLKNINDDAKTLCELSQKCFAFGIMPYYLHLLDKVQGAAHFAISDDRAVAIWTEMANNLSGYMLPKLVRERSDLGFKQILSANS